MGNESNTPKEETTQKNGLNGPIDHPNSLDEDSMGFDDGFRQHGELRGLTVIGYVMHAGSKEIKGVRDEIPPHPAALVIQDGFQVMMSEERLQKGADFYREQGDLDKVKILSETLEELQTYIKEGKFDGIAHTSSSSDPAEVVPSEKFGIKPEPEALDPNRKIASLPVFKA